MQYSRREKYIGENILAYYFEVSCTKYQYSAETQTYQCTAPGMY